MKRASPWEVLALLATLHAAAANVITLGLFDTKTLPIKLPFNTGHDAKVVLDGGDFLDLSSCAVEFGASEWNQQKSIKVSVSPSARASKFLGASSGNGNGNLSVTVKGRIQYDDCEEEKTIEWNVEVVVAESAVCKSYSDPYIRVFANHESQYHGLGVVTLLKTQTTLIQTHQIECGKGSAANERLAVQYGDSVFVAHSNEGKRLTIERHGSDLIQHDPYRNVLTLPDGMTIEFYHTLNRDRNYMDIVIHAPPYLASELSLAGGLCGTFEERLEATKWDQFLDKAGKNDLKGLFACGPKNTCAALRTTSQALPSTPSSAQTCKFPSKKTLEVCETTAPPPGRDPNTPVPGTNVPTPGTNVPTPGTYVPTPGTNVPTPGTDVPIPGTGVPQPPPGSNVTTPGTSVPCPTCPCTSGNCGSIHYTNITNIYPPSVNNVPPTGSVHPCVYVFSSISCPRFDTSALIRLCMADCRSNNNVLDVLNHYIEYVEVQCNIGEKIITRIEELFRPRPPTPIASPPSPTPAPQPTPVPQPSPAPTPCTTGTVASSTVPIVAPTPPAIDYGVSGPNGTAAPTPSGSPSSPSSLYGNSGAGSTGSSSGSGSGGVKNNNGKPLGVTSTDAASTAGDVVPTLLYAATIFYWLFG